MKSTLRVFCSFGVVLPKNRTYAVVPTSGNDLKTEIKTLAKSNSFVAPWNYCSKNQDKWDHIDSFETLTDNSTTCKIVLQASNTLNLHIVIYH